LGWTATFGGICCAGLKDYFEVWHWSNWSKDPVRQNMETETLCALTICCGMSESFQPPEGFIWKIIVAKTWKLTSLLYLQLQTLNTWMTTHNQCHCFTRCTIRNTQTKKWFHITFHVCLSRKHACLNIKWNSFLNMEIKCHWNFSLAQRAQF
jgi:hypothetical protein